MTKLRILGRAVITVSEMPLRHRRLGSVEFAHGEAAIAGKETLVFVAEDESGKSKVTARTRDSSGYVDVEMTTPDDG